MTESQFYIFVATNTGSLLVGAFVLYGRLVKVETRVDLILKKIFDNEE